VQGGAKIVGVTKDDQLVYVTTTGTPSLNAVPLAGGTPTVLAQSFDPDTSVALVSGGAVGFWTNVSDHVGTFNLWSRTGGLKTNLTQSHDSAVNVFAATADGSRIAFSVGTDSSFSTDLAIANASSVALTTSGIFNDSLIDTAAMRGSAPTCSPQIRFAQRALIMAFCSGTSSIASAARLYYVADGATTATRLDEIGNATGNIKPFWFSDVNGTKIYAVASGGSEAARIVTPPVNGAAPTSVELDPDAANAGFITNDGQTVVYRTPELGLRRASTGPNPSPQTLVPGVRTIEDISADLTKVLVRTLDANGSLRDIRSADVLTLNQKPHDIVPTATVRPLGFTGDSAFVLYLSDVSGSSNHLTSQAATGGASKDLADNVSDVLIPESGPGAVVLTGTGSNISIKYVNASTGQSSPVLATQVPAGGLMTMNQKLVWVTEATSAPGIFVAPIP
jgi:hypothetical protein